jgi:HSP20 family protein
MMTKKESALTRRGSAGDPFTVLRQMTSELDRMFDEPGWPLIRWPIIRTPTSEAATTWLPGIDVFEKDDRLVTKIDLPGMKKEDVKVEVTDGQLTISGERTSEAEEKKDRFFRCERAYGSFYRSVPLPNGVKLEDVKATFGDGVLEVSVPLPAQPEAKVRKVEIQEGPKAVKAA